MKTKHIILITIASLLLLLLLLKLFANGLIETSGLRELGYSISESQHDGTYLDIIKTSPDTLHLRHNDLIIEECWIQCTYRVNYKWIFIREQVLQKEDLVLCIKSKIVGDNILKNNDIVIWAIEPHYGYGFDRGNGYIYHLYLDSLFKDTLHCKVNIELMFVEDNEDYNLIDTTSQLLLLFPSENKNY